MAKMATREAYGKALAELYGNKRKHRICKYIRNVRCRTCV